MIKKSSSNDKTHPYLRGFSFWDKNRYWKNGMYSTVTQIKMDAWVDQMQKDDKTLTRVDQSITKSKNHH